MSRLLQKGFLFKYIPYNEYLFNLLVNGEFWMSPPDKLNGPFEGDFRINNINKYHNEIFIKKLLDLQRKNFIDDLIYDDQLEKALIDRNYFSNILYEYINRLIRNKYGISCFTKNYKSLKMWSHYADSHKGLCLIYDEKELETSLLGKKIGVTLKEVDYCKSLPLIDIINHDCDENGDDYIGIPEKNTFLFNKLNSWQEEKEIRLLYDKEFNVFPDRTLKYDKTSLKGIIFGARIEIKNIVTIVNLINHSNQKDKVKFYKANKNLEKTSIIINKLNL